MLRGQSTHKRIPSRLALIWAEACAFFGVAILFYLFTDSIFACSKEEKLSAQEAPEKKRKRKGDMVETALKTGKRVIGAKSCSFVKRVNRKGSSCPRTPEKNK